MRKRLQEEKEADIKTAIIFEEEQRTVASALAQPDDEIIKSITDIKIQIAKDLDSISENRLTEFKKLSEIEKAAAIETKRLQELYEICHGMDLNSNGSLINKNRVVVAKMSLKNS